jgi:hypothetical protein
MSVTDAILAAARNHPEKIGGSAEKNRVGKIWLLNIWDYELFNVKKQDTNYGGDISTLFQGHFQTKLIIYKRAQIFIRRNRRHRKMTNGIIIDMIWSMFFLILVL